MVVARANKTNSKGFSSSVKSSQGGGEDMPTLLWHSALRSAPPAPPEFYPCVVTPVIAVYVGAGGRRVLSEVLPIRSVHGVSLHRGVAKAPVCNPPLLYNWLRVLDTAERPQIDQGICHQLHPIVSLLDAFKSEQQPLELIFPRKGPLDTHPQGMDGGVEEPLAPTLGALAVAGVLFDVGDHPRIENALAIRSGV